MDRSIETLWLLRFLCAEYLVIGIMIFLRLGAIDRAIKNIPEEKQTEVLNHIAALDQRHIEAMKMWRQQQSAEHGEMISVLKYIRHLTQRTLIRFGFLVDNPGPPKDSFKPNKED